MEEPAAPEEEKKETKDGPLPPLPSVPVEKPNGEDLLRSQLKAFEGEILNLRADKQMLEQDKQELSDAIEKFKQGVLASEDSVNAMKAENQTLKLEMKGHLAKSIDAEKRIEGLLAKTSILQQQLLDSKGSEKQAKEALESNKAASASMLSLKEQELKKLQDQHAMEIGRAKRLHSEEKESILQNHSKKVHESEAFYRQSKQELLESIQELKDTVANQATRIYSYEQKIEQLDSENNRLRIQNQLSSRNKLTVTQQQEIEGMKLQAQRQEEDIDKLKMALDMININQHYDFRGLTGT